MARYKLILAYDGTAFAGSQRQTARRTVQSELEKALRSVGWSGRTVLLAGRTDRGVHAAGQVAAADLEWRHGPERLREALNARLPADLAVQQVEEAGPEFHPRFDARSRRYSYRIFCGKVRDPLREKMAWRVWPDLQEDVLQEAAALFVGQHDFGAFGSPSREQSSTLRRVLASEWQPEREGWQYQVRADAFLYRMVRRLVFVQVAVAQGTCLKESVVAALGQPHRKNEMPAGLAPAHGLTLVEVSYGVDQA